MPDSRSFVFVRKVREEEAAALSLYAATGTIVQLTHVKQGVSSPVVSHAGDRIALSVTDSDPRSRRLH